MIEPVPRHTGRGNDSARWLRSWLSAYGIDLVSLEMGRRGDVLVWIATVMSEGSVTKHTVDMPEGHWLHTKPALRRVGQQVVKERGQ